MSTLLVFKQHPTEENLLVYSDIIFEGDVIHKGIIQAVQEYIRDEDILDNEFEDEHRGLDVVSTSDTSYYYSLDELLTLSHKQLCISPQIKPDYFCQVRTNNGYYLYVFIKQ